MFSTLSTIDFIISDTFKGGPLDLETKNLQKS